MDNSVFMKEAIELSKQNISTNEGGPFGCVIVYRNEIIAKGTNNVVKNLDPTAHAEVCAIRSACKSLNTIDLSDCDIYSSCEPCPMCFGAIKWAKIKRVYYSNTRKDASKIGFSDEDIYTAIENKTLNMIHLPSKDALKVFELWESDEKNIKY